MSNLEIADHVDCYMADLVECFELFVKRSLLLISIGVAAIVAILVFSLKILIDRSPTSTTLAVCPSTCSNVSRDDLIRNVDKQDYKKRICKRGNKNLYSGMKPSLGTSSSFNNTNRINTTSGLDTCPKRPEEDHCSNKVVQCRAPAPVSCMSPCSSNHSMTSQPSKHLIPSLPIKVCVKSVAKNSSCCSICCSDTNLNVK